MQLLAAADVNITDPASPYNSLYNLRPSQLLTTAINLFLGAAGVIAFIYLLWGGIQWIMAGSDKEAIDRARKRIMHALIGLAIVFSSYALIYIIRVLFQINTISLNISNL
ncbi:hypothetical protein A3H89_02010 [Candidatus Amesbacteria bacterium RIFCSPLOWO2_02_FULL_48_11]|nr:MAG: hypothetical protein A3H89_02010 [Candidatus Amesbacteria bacterium RIFCSPLOWO2_02_FULL_48_11]